MRILARCRPTLSWLHARFADRLPTTFREHRPPTWAYYAIAAGLVLGAVLVFWPGWGILHHWQQAVGSIVGFVALAFAVFLTAWQQRRRDDRLRCQDADALRGALAAEFYVIRGRLLVARWKLRRDEKAFEKHPIEACRPPTPEIFQTLRDRLDRLTPAECMAVVKAKGQVDRLDESIDDNLHKVTSLTLADGTVQDGTHGDVDARMNYSESVKAVCSILSEAIESLNIACCMLQDTAQTRFNLEWDSVKPSLSKD